jgi:hypothetical protein
MTTPRRRFLRRPLVLSRCRSSRALQALKAYLSQPITIDRAARRRSASVFTRSTPAACAPTYK